MTTEGTYPYFVGGVSSWCKQVIGEIDNVDWLLVPIVPASVHAEPIFPLPAHAYGGDTDPALVALAGSQSERAACRESTSPSSRARSHARCSTGTRRLRP